jgi:hypothetical protein
MNCFQSIEFNFGARPYMTARLVGVVSIPAAAAAAACALTAGPDTRPLLSLT